MPDRRPTRRGIPASQIASAGFQYVVKEIETSNRDWRRIFRATAKTDSSLFVSSTRSIAGLFFQTLANSSSARTVMELSGRPSLIARTAGKVATASVGEAGETMRIRNGSSVDGSKFGGKNTRR